MPLSTHEPEKLSERLISAFVEFISFHMLPQTSAGPKVARLSVSPVRAPGFGDTKQTKTTLALESIR